MMLYRNAVILSAMSCFQSKSAAMCITIFCHQLVSCFPSHRLIYCHQKITAPDSKHASQTIMHHIVPFKKPTPQHQLSRFNPCRNEQANCQTRPPGQFLMKERRQETAITCSAGFPSAFPGLPGKLPSRTRKVPAHIPGMLLAPG